MTGFACESEPKSQPLIDDCSRSFVADDGCMVRVAVAPSAVVACPRQTHRSPGTKLQRLVHALKTYCTGKRRQAVKDCQNSVCSSNKATGQDTCVKAAKQADGDGGRRTPPAVVMGHLHQHFGDPRGARRHSNPDIGTNYYSAPRALELQRMFVELAEPVRPTSVYAVHKQLRRHHKDNMYRASDPGADAVSAAKSIWTRRHDSVISLPLLEDAPWDPDLKPVGLETSCPIRHLRQPSWNLPQACTSPTCTGRHDVHQPASNASNELCEADDVFLESELPSRQSSFKSSGSFSSQYSRKSSWRSYSESLDSAGSRQTYIKTSPKFHKRRETDSEAVTNLGQGASYSGLDLNILAREIGLKLGGGSPCGSPPGQSCPLDTAEGAPSALRSAVTSSPRGSPTSAKSAHPAVRLRRLRSQASLNARLFDEPRPVIPVRPGVLTVYESAGGSRGLRKLRSMPTQHVSSESQVSGGPIPRSLSSVSTATRRRELSYS